jgi:hypothetical protein
MIKTACSCSISALSVVVNLATRHAVAAGWPCLPSWSSCTCLALQTPAAPASKKAQHAARSGQGSTACPSQTGAGSLTGQRWVLLWGSHQCAHPLRIDQPCGREHECVRMYRSRTEHARLTRQQLALEEAQGSYVSVSCLQVALQPTSWHCLAKTLLAGSCCRHSCCFVVNLASCPASRAARAFHS